MTTNSEFLFSGGGAAAYQIERSVRFNSADSAYLSRTPSVAGNQKTWTWSGWVKRSGFDSYQYFFTAGTSNNQAAIRFNDDNTLSLFDFTGTFDWILRTAQVFRDPSAWYHIVAVFDTDNAAADNRMRLYVNGIEITVFASRVNPVSGSTSPINSNVAHAIGSPSFTSSYYFSGYLADVHFIDGQALDPTSFGEFDANGVWQPKAYTGTYGTNGFHLPFSDNSTAAALGTDTSGNSNTWTTNNLSVAAGAGNDSLTDTPTNYGTDTGVGSEVRGNYATLNPLNSTGTQANGNLEAVPGPEYSAVSTITTPLSGKWYSEFVWSSGTGGAIVGITKAVNSGKAIDLPGYSGSYGYINVNGNKRIANVDSAYGATYAVGDVIGVSIDADTSTLTFYKNGVSQGNLTIDVAEYYFYVYAGNGSSGITWIANFGQRPFAYAAPTGFKALCTQNLPDPTIADGSTAMDVALYTGNGSTQTISGLGFSPDLVWIKSRISGYYHNLLDTIRGGNARLSSNTTDAESDGSGGGATPLISTFNSDGFTLPNSNVNVNANSNAYVAWTWDAGSSTVTNTDGSITSQVRANPSAGFSVVSWTGDGSTGTVGHGLGVLPSLYIIKDRSLSDNWYVYTTAINGSLYYGFLNSTTALASSVLAAPTSSGFTVTGGINTSSSNFITYCFAPVAGYSAFGSYTGNGSNDGPFVYTGFRPRWVLIKASSGISNGPWMLYDTARNTYNLSNNKLYANESSAENASSGGDNSGTNGIDILSNGFKHRQTNYFVNGSGNTYIYAAFAENPFKTARAR